MEMASGNAARPRKAVPREPQGSRSLGRTGPRALLILEQFGRQRGPLRAVDIIAETGWAASSVDQLLKSLVSSGFLLFNQRSKNYYPSPRLSTFARWMSLDSFGSSDLQLLVQAVSRRTGEFAAITAQNDCHMQVVACAGSEEWRDDRRFHTKLPLIDTICGQAMIAGYAEPEIVYFAHRARYFSGSRRSPEEVVMQAQEHRSVGWVSGDASPWGHLAPPAMRNSVWAVAMQIPPGKIGGQAVILGLGGPAARLRGNETGLVSTMQDTLNQVLGAAA